MVILSQDKSLLVKFDSIEMIGLDPNDRNSIYCTFNDGAEFLGTYQDENRAKEILNEISVAYANLQMIHIPNINIHERIPATELIRNIRYTMPER